MQEPEKNRYEDCYEDYIRGSVTPCDMPRLMKKTGSMVVLQTDSEGVEQSKYESRKLAKTKSASALGTTNYSNSSLSNHKMQK